MMAPKWMLQICKAFCYILTGSKYITADQLQKAIDDDEVTIIDARHKVEFTQSHIKNAYSLYDLNSDDIDKLDRNRLIVTYCAIGLRSGYLAKRLERQEFNNIKVLKYGYYTWANSNRPLYNKIGQTNKVMPQHVIAEPFLDPKIKKNKYKLWTWSKVDFQDRRRLRKEKKLKQKILKQRLQHKLKPKHRKQVVIRKTKTIHIIKFDQRKRIIPLHSKRDKSEILEQLP